MSDDGGVQIARGERDCETEGFRRIRDGNTQGVHLNDITNLKSIHFTEWDSGRGHCGKRVRKRVTKIVTRVKCNVRCVGKRIRSKLI